MSDRPSAPLLLVGIVVVLVVSGSALPAPPPGGVGTWLDQVGAVVAAVTLVRLVALAAALLLLLVWVASALAQAAGALRLAVALERAFPPALRRVLGGVAGVGAVGSALVAAGSAPLPSAADGRSAAAGPVATLSRSDLATMHVDDPVPAAGPEATMQVVEDAAPVRAPAEWLVEPGDSFWSIAEEVVADRLARSGSDAEVAAYWSRFVAANRDRLVTGDPDVILPGQRLVLVH